MKKLIILILIAIAAVYISNKNEYVEIPSSSIRMRVIASDNTEENQSKKKIIKTVLESALYDLIEDADDIENVDKVILDNKDKIDKKIEDKIKEDNMNLSFTSNYGLNYFPEKEYKGLLYEAGNYKSYVVTLGEGKGENWWCVLYPPLCLIDEGASDYDYHYLIKDVLDKYN